MVSPEAIEKAFADIEVLQKEVRSLKTRLGKLTNRVTLTELQGLQDQISHLDERTTSFSKEFNEKIQDYENQLLGLQCYVSASHINEDVDVFCNLLDTSNIRDKSNIQTQLITDASSTKAEIFNSNRPNTLAVDFHTKWSKYLTDIGIKFVSS
jgi:DNA repair exonuclease SbcCD ATPase subunit